VTQQDTPNNVAESAGRMPQSVVKVLKMYFHWYCTEA